MNINLFQNLLLNLCVCRNAPVGFREAEERQFVRARGPPHFRDTGQGAPPETDGRPPLTPLHGMALLQKNLKVGVRWLKANVIHTNNSCQNLCYICFGREFEKNTHFQPCQNCITAVMVYRTPHSKATYRQSGGLSISASAWQIGLKCCVPDLVRDAEFGFCRSVRPG